MGSSLSTLNSENPERYSIRESLTKHEFGEIEDEFDMEVFTWKIYNVSSIPHDVDYFVQSPPFYFDGATWILKIYPYGQTKYQSKGYIDVTIERLHSQVELHHFFFKIYCINAFDQEVNPKTNTFTIFSTLTQKNIPHFMQNLKACPLKELFAPNDILTLVFEFGKSGKSSNQPNERNMVNRNEGNSEIGDLFKEYSDFKNFTWRAWDIPHFPLPEDYKAPSPQFSFANATWILEISPYYRMKHLNLPSFDVMLKRLQSEIPEHFVIFKIILEYPDRKIVEKSFYFNAHHTEGEMINFQLLEKDIPKMDKLCFEVEMKMKKSVAIALHPQVTSAVDD